MDKFAPGTCTIGLLLLTFCTGSAVAEDPPVVSLILSPSAQNVGTNWPDYASDVQALHANPSPDKFDSNINDYRFQDDQLNVDTADGDIMVLRTDQKILLRKFVTVVFPVQFANPREIVNGLRILTGKEGGRAEVLLNGDKQTKAIQVVCPEFQLPYIRQVVAMMDRPWVQDFEDGSSATYYKAKHRDIAFIDAVAFDAGTPDQSFRQIDKKNNAIFYHDDSGSIGGYMSIVEKVDVPPHQVLVDVSVYEITEQNDEKLGLDYIAWKNGPGADLFQFVLAGHSSRQRFKNVSSIFDPFMPTRIISTIDGTNKLDSSSRQEYAAGNYLITAAFIDFLAVKGKAKILTSGKLVAKSGTQGTFERVDSLVAFTPRLDVADGITTRTLDYSLIDQEVGFFLHMTPFIGTESLEADIIVDLSTINGVTPQGLPIINHRTMTSSAVLRDGQPYVLGGLRLSSKTRGKAGMPFLSDIPVAGYLFGGRTKTGLENRVVIVMKPSVMLDKSTEVASVEQAAEPELLVDGVDALKEPRSSLGFDMYPNKK